MVTTATQKKTADTLAKAAIRAAKGLGLTQEELGSIVGRDRTSLSRGLDPNSKAGEMALLLIRSYRSLFSLVGGDSRALRHWFATANLDTGGVPCEQVKSVAGLVRICDYLDAMRGKV